MANPQKENGGTIIANEIMDALCRFRIPGNVRQIVDAIIRKTYGWNKKEDWVAHSQIVEATGLLKGIVSRELSKAITHKIVIAHDNKLRLNKNYEEWISFSGQHFNPNPSKVKLSDTITNKKLSDTISPVIVSEKKVIVSEGNKIHYTKYTNTKYNINGFISLFKEINPSYERLFSNKTERASLDRLIRKYGEEWVTKLIKKLPEITSKPYAPRITTPYQLEHKLGELKSFLQQEKNKIQKGGVDYV